MLLIYNNRKKNQENQCLMQKYRINVNVLWETVKATIQGWMSDAYMFWE